MSNEYTPVPRTREEAQRLRTAFRLGAEWAREYLKTNTILTRADAQLAAVQQFGPKDLIVRVRRDPVFPAFAWRVTDTLEVGTEIGARWAWYPAHTGAEDAPLFAHIPERVALWQDLQTNPTEEVDDDD